MTFTVPDMSCGHCKSAIEAALSKAGGRASIDLAAKTVTVEGLDREAALAAIRAAGYEVAAS
ncbi:heavy-metal-associated domain-containing protein [Paracoccus marinaquae]|uniref:Cation transporter n=1 Tax=Paracoccus marinaquae TaxID=2841926 RepID=A0ABS6AJA9_9RHOB|nr:cation transporter [Paracoccus marinaquae]MBU3030680.1 cation transporter [Paracoccus marinaquae]